MSEIVRIPLRDGQFALIDAGDAPAVLARRWTLAIKSNSLYATSAIGRGRNVQLHTFLMNPPEGFVVDHRNGNGLDNRRENLRVVTKSQNHMNRRKRLGTSSRFKGVYWHKKSQAWMARIHVDGKTTFLGNFRDEVEAAAAYNAAAIETFGEHARLNPVDGVPIPDGGFFAARPHLKTRPPKPLPVPVPHPEFPDAVTIDLGRGYRTIIDADDADEVCRHRWYANIKEPGVVYAVGGGRPQIGLHVFLMRPPAGMVVDHVRGDKLDNRRSQLRIVTDQQNKWNNRGRDRTEILYKGIIWQASRGRWRAAITVGGKSHFLGRFNDPRQAAEAYDAAAKKHFGEFARLNFDSQPQPEDSGPH